MDSNTNPSQTTPKEIEVTPSKHMENMINITNQELKANKVKAGPGRIKPPAETLIRRQEVMNSIKLYGGYGLPIKELATRHNVAERIIYKDVEYLMRNIPKPNILEIGSKFKISYETLLQKANRMLNDPDKAVQKDGAELFLKGSESYTKFLERYGYKSIQEQNSMPINVTVDNRSVEVVNVKFEIPKELEEELK